ncbi:ATP-binding protein [Streptomyces sp. WAC 01529]|uniref:ATP-binding protein n=1 Tax=Streptomyces sp. WAC 01529 TaxID=2203205 RepID=UPI000F720796|nr:ATP-binding protein [Streptomyces sp. WAC 01529]AZM55098.1 ATP-binding protein [Streptomyces sp. WAC 01529]
MKQSAAKTLGVAALGAAFAAAGAGAANAAAGLPDVTSALGPVSSVLPLGEAAKTLPAGAPQSLAAAQTAVAGGLTALQPSVDKVVSSALPPQATTKGAGAASAAPAAPASPVSGLLGGLPLGGTGVNGLPLG